MALQLQENHDSSLQEPEFAGFTPVGLKMWSGACKQRNGTDPLVASQDSGVYNMPYIYPHSPEARRPLAFIAQSGLPVKRFCPTGRTVQMVAMVNGNVVEASARRAAS
jgi:hypothetical protein